MTSQQRVWVRTNVTATKRHQTKRWCHLLRIWLENKNEDWIFEYFCLVRCIPNTDITFSAVQHIHKLTECKRKVLNHILCDRAEIPPCWTFYHCKVENNYLYQATLFYQVLWSQYLSREHSLDHLHKISFYCENCLRRRCCWVCLHLHSWLY